MNERLPTVLPKWLRDWAEACRVEAQTGVDTYWGEDPKRFALLWKLLSDVEVANGFARLSKEVPDNQDVTDFLYWACRYFEQCASIKVFLNFSQQDKTNQLLEKLSYELAKKISDFSPYTPISPSVRYLSQRAAAGNPANFSVARQGLRRGKYQLDPGLGLSQLLEAFAADVEEQRQFIAHHKNEFNNEAGRNASVNLLTDKLAWLACHMFGEPKHTLIARMAGTMRDEEIPESRLAKRWEARKIRR